jgi:hypothetical protein
MNDRRAFQLHDVSQTYTPEDNVESCIRTRYRVAEKHLVEELIFLPAFA